jgi:hypothetical protein
LISVRIIPESAVDFKPQPVPERESRLMDPHRRT